MVCKGITSGKLPGKLHKWLMFDASCCYEVMPVYDYRLTHAFQVEFDWINTQMNNQNSFKFLVKIGISTKHTLLTYGSSQCQETSVWSREMLVFISWWLFLISILFLFSTVNDSQHGYSDSSEMVKVIVQTVQNQDKVLKDLYAHLR